eukprot:TRINITY_DN18746_c0_g1_i1.p1 TRINITY_DN18746_c0_g1~~TRINITY_DN18746_c0_g1_i1.p1  ORF type:complete len:110 (+),score=1.04 TRINITY_DN18746_c0_g1_i1:193-522(+)
MAKRMSVMPVIAQKSIAAIRLSFSDEAADATTTDQRLGSHSLVTLTSSQVCRIDCQAKQYFPWDATQSLRRDASIRTTDKIFCLRLWLSRGEIVPQPQVCRCADSGEMR